MYKCVYVCLSVGMCRSAGAREHRDIVSPGARVTIVNLQMWGLELSLFLGPLKVQQAVTALNC
jgi:hypothetical protein